MSNPISRLLPRLSVRDDIRHALESGVGLYHHTWTLEDDAGAGLPEHVMTWCREVLSGTRRPYGLDHTTLAVILLDIEEAEVASVNYGILRPTDFYSPRLIEQRLRETLRAWGDDQLIADTSRLSVLLFSWGDLTRELLAG